MQDNIVNIWIEELANTHCQTRQKHTLSNKTKTHTVKQDKAYERHALQTKLPMGTYD